MLVAAHADGAHDVVYVDCLLLCVLFFFFNDTATTEIYTLSLHDALPISLYPRGPVKEMSHFHNVPSRERSEEHTSELQSRVDISYAVFCLKKKQHTNKPSLTRPASPASPFATHRSND